MKSFHTHIEPKIEELINHAELELKNLLGDKLRRIILYGSYSRGDYDDESDIDLIALVEEK